jgi:hypothetical protein
VSLYNNMFLHIVINSSDKGYYSIWQEYCSQYHCDAKSSNSPLLSEFNSSLFHDVHDAPFFSIQDYSSAELESKEIQDHVFHILGQLNFTTVSWGFSWYYQPDFVIWLFEIWNVS